MPTLVFNFWIFFVNSLNSDREKFNPPNMSDEFQLQLVMKYCNLVVTINSMIISLDSLTGGGVNRWGINRKDPSFFTFFSRISFTIPPLDSLHYNRRIRFYLQISIQPIRSVDTSYMSLKVFHFVLPLSDVFESVSLCPLFSLWGDIVKLLSQQCTSWTFRGPKHNFTH